MSSISTTCSTSFTSTSTSTSTARLFDRLSPAQQKQIEALEGYADSLAIDGSNASSVLSSIDTLIAQMLKDKALWEKSEYDLIGVQKQVAGMRWRISRIQSGEEVDRDLSLDKEGLRLIIDRISKTTKETMFLNRDKLYVEALKKACETNKKLDSLFYANIEELSYSNAKSLVINSSITLPSQPEYGKLLNEFNVILRSGVTSHTMEITAHLITKMIERFCSTIQYKTKNEEETNSLMDFVKNKIQSLVKYGLDLNVFTRYPSIHNHIFEHFTRLTDVEQTEKWLTFLVNQGLNINLQWTTSNFLGSVNQSILERFLSTRFHNSTWSQDINRIKKPIADIVKTCVFLGATADDAVVKASANSFSLASEQYARLRPIRVGIEEQNDKEIGGRVITSLNDLLLIDLISVVKDYALVTSPQGLFDLCEQEYERLYPSTSSSSSSTSSAPTLPPVSISTSTSTTVTTISTSISIPTYTSTSTSSSILREPKRKRDESDNIDPNKRLK